MAVRRKNARRAGKDAQLAFEAIYIEGGLLSPDWLARAAQLAASQQSEADYRIPKGLNLRDEIGRYWRIAQAYQKDFARAIEQGVDPLISAQRFVTDLLRESFGFSSLVETPPVTMDDRLYPIGHSAQEGRVPVVIAPAQSGLDSQLPAFGDGTRRRSAFGLTQEFLNAADGALWGLCCDGVTLRIARDNASLTRPAWIEADLSRIFSEERYADFAALWLLIHETRFGRPSQPVTDCALELWRVSGREQGTRAREQLREGVEDALLCLGQGFLSHPENQVLRDSLHQGTLTPSDYFQQLLRLVYRLIFLITAEERELLHPKDADPSSIEVYQSGYSMRLLRERCTRRSAHDRFSDVWEALRIVFRALSDGEPRLGLPALAGLYAPSQCAYLDASRLHNRALLQAVFRLTWLREPSGLSRVNWRDMGPEELGSVYESLLELVPQITKGGHLFQFASGGETKGNARKLSGSYYTPEGLVQVLLDSALDPVIADTVAKHPSDPHAALLRLSIVDPACGSGHFLLAAARRLAGQLARIAAGGTPSAADYRHALRQVVGRCIYGVDLNPMAVELCKVSLWMEALEPGLPLSFLDSHIQHGNSLLGATPTLLAQGIPDAAWEPLEGDDKKAASALKKRNKTEFQGQRTMDSLFAKPIDKETTVVTQAVSDLESAADSSVTLLHQKETQWQGILDSAPYRHQRAVADAFCAAFVWPKQAGLHAETAPTNGVWCQLRDGQPVSPLTVETSSLLAKQFHFFHWHLQFPHVFAKGGFDVVLGNPPWERVKLQEQEFFASRSEDIANAVNAAARKKRIAQLPETDPQLWKEWCAASREAEGHSHFIRQSGRFPLCGKGDVNTYSIFAEHNRSLLHSHGRAGFIVPTGIATDDSTKAFFSSLVGNAQLARFYSFENAGGFFPSVHFSFNFALLTLDRSGRSRSADLVFFARQVSALAEASRHFSLSADDFATLNPNTKTCPTFRCRRDAEINLRIYRRAGILWREDAEDGNPWGLRFLRMLDMAMDSDLFRTQSDLLSAGGRRIANVFHLGGRRFLPLVEAKMVHHYDHRFGTYEGQTQAQENQGKLPEFDDTAHADPNRLTIPYYWVESAEVDARLSEKWNRGWLLGWRDICRSTDQRTTIASLVPVAATGDTFLIALPSVQPTLVGNLYANLISICFDYAARQKVGGTHLKYHTFKQLPVLSPDSYLGQTPWAASVVLRDWILSRVLELTYTAWDLESFARDVGYDGPPFRWDAGRRFLLRAELDAAFFHLYGIARNDVDYVMETFLVVKRNDEKAHGEYRTKRVILEIYDAMSDAARSGQAYPSRLDPPPSDPRIAHPQESRRNS